MADFANCVRSAQKQKQLSEDEANDLIERYERYRSAHAAAGQKDPEAAAKTSLMADFDADAVKKRAIAASTARATTNSRTFAETYRPIGSDKPDIGNAFVAQLESQAEGTTSAKYRGIALAYHFQSIMADNINAFHRKFFGWNKRADLPRIRNAGREIYGEATGDAPAKNLGESASLAFETSRQEYNRAAGFEAIGKIDNYIPQSNNPALVLKVPYEEWRGDYLARMHMEKTTDPLTKQPLKNSSPERLESIMRAAYENIVTEGWASKDPKAVPQGVGALAGQRSDHRFFHYKSFDDWDFLNTKYGSGDFTTTVFEHLRGMANDIAMMDNFGGNPRAWLEWAKQSIVSESKKALLGQPTLYAGKPGTDAGNKQAARLEAVFNSLSGPQVLSRNLANGFADTANVLTSAQLGSTIILAASTDPFINRAARSLWGLPQWKAAFGMFSGMRSAQSKAQMVRSGIGLDDLLHVTGDEARYAGTLGGHVWSKVLADRTTRWSGLQAMTQGQKHAIAKDWQGLTADHAGMTWEEFHTRTPYFADALDRYGFTKADWDELRKTPLFIPKEGSAGFLQPSDVKNRDLGIRYAAMILAETERAVPTQSHRARAHVNANLQRGTWSGEIINSVLQYKNFTMSFMAGHSQATMIEATRGNTSARGALYAGGLFVGLTIGGAISLQINAILSGKDLHPMDPTTAQGLKFWIHAMLKGGSFGILGDFMFADYTRYGASPVTQFAGPTIGLVSDALELTVGNVQKGLTGKPDPSDPYRLKKVSRETIRTVGRNVPIVSTNPFTKAAYQRVVLDQLMYLTDPEAYKYFHEQQQRLRQNTGQRYFWPPGEMEPARAPEMSEAKR